MKTELALTLASASPRRRELLATLGLDFSIALPEIDETPKFDEKPRALTERLAKEKAATVTVGGIVIAADTLVVQGERILGKPTDEQHAIDMLRSLSNSTHEVITGVCMKSAERTVIFSVKTQVTFRTVAETEIVAYVATGEPMDKAGAYAIQGGAAHMIRRIEGSYTNVVGLPLCELHEALISF